METPFVPPALGPALPEIFLLIAACAILVLDVFLRDEQRHVSYNLVQLSLLGALLLVLFGHGDGTTLAFSGHYVKDAFSDLLKGSIFVISAAVFLYSREYLRERGLFTGEYYLLGLFGVLGMSIMASAGSFLTVYLGLELFSLSTYALVALQRDSARASEAAMKYFVLGALASGMLLYGISMIYGATGELLLGEVFAAVANHAAVDAAGSGVDLVLVFGLVFLVVGLGFKLGAVPFHMWLPDVYQGAPTSVTLYVGAAPKIAAFALLIRVLVDGLGPLLSDWSQMLVVLAALSVVGGNLIALVQSNIKRMLAYSTIAHVGFLLLGVLAGPDGYAPALFYVITYALMATGAFGVLLILSRNGVEAEQVSDLKGLNDRSPWLAFIMLLLMMSLAGIPFLVGFYAKLAVLQAVVSAGYLWLALLAVVFSVVGAFYYLRVVKTMYFDSPSLPAVDVGVDAELDTQVVISVNGLLLIALGLYPTALMSLCAAALLR